ncbi:MAG: hypothetical protein GWP08_11985 [Nitrospiraceae bacterium]|nr:hypothetical protein [Nitrospiraceae bacterium]
MTDTPSKRLRLRFFPEDEQALRDAREATTHNSNSAVIRAALSLYEQAWSSMQSGFQVLYSPSSSRSSPDRMRPVLSAEGEPYREEPGVTRAKAERSIEIRVTPGDCERIKRLRTLKAAGTSSEAVRRAVRLYAEAVRQARAGRSITAVSPSGDALAIAIPGVVSPTAAGPIGAFVAPRPGVVAAITDLRDILPDSLAEMVSQAAEAEQCPVNVLLTDMVRTQALLRLGNSATETPTVETAESIETAAPVMAIPEPVEAPEPSVMEETSAPLVGDLSKSLEEMAAGIRRLLEQAAVSAKRGAQRGDLADLLAEPTDAAGDLATVEDTPTLENLTQRAQDLCRLLNTAVEASGRKKKRQRTKRAASETPPPEQDQGPVQTMLLPPD